MSPPRSCTAIERARHALGLLLALAGAPQAQAADAGTVMDLSGPLLVQRADGRPGALGQRSAVAQGTTLVTPARSHARIRFVDGGELVLLPGTRLRIDRFEFDAARPDIGSARFVLEEGAVRLEAGAMGQPGAGRQVLDTPGGRIDVQGGTFLARYVAAAEPGDARAAWRAASIAWQASAACCDSDAGPGVSPVADALRLAQLSPGSAPLGLSPGLYVHVIDGLIQLSNRGGVQQFAAGQFGFTGSVVQAPVIVPQNPGIQFNPPPGFTASSTPAGTTSGSKGTVDCEVR